jgi:type I restriction enzyme S subunit
VLPPARDRQLIVETLGAIDDKIELHRRMAETLEAIARTIFKSWFVDFDPVRAKIQGQPTGLPDDLAALFPDGFSEEGVPESWRYAPIVECFDLLSGGTPKTSVREYWDGHIPWFSVVDAPLESAPFVLATERLITQLGLENCASALLPLGTTIITARGTVGKLAIVGVPMAMNQSCYAAVPKAGYSTYFNYFAIRHVIEDLKTKSHGSVFSTITRQTFDSTITTLPPAILAKAYDHLTASLMNKIKLQLEQSRTLAALRDALLPKLISGELRIADADNRIVAA